MNILVFCHSQRLEKLNELEATISCSMYLVNTIYKVDIHNSSR